MSFENKSKLKFLGTGNAFTKNNGNNAAFLEWEKEVLLFDCGEDVYGKLLKYGLIENKSRYHIFITHLHSDHVGSLGSLIAYLYYVAFKGDKSRICVYFPTQALVDMLRLQGVEDEWYTFFMNRFDEVILDSMDKNMEYIFEENEHTKALDYKGQPGAYSIEISIKKNFSFYYSSDCSIIKDRLISTKIYDEIYHEVSSIKTPVHTSYEELVEAFKAFSPKEKKRIWLMHYDDEFDVERAIKDGFSVAQRWSPEE